MSNVINVEFDARSNTYQPINTTYEHAAREAGEDARRAFEQIIQKSKPLVGQLVQHIESQIPNDKLVSTRHLWFETSGSSIFMDFGGGPVRMHRNAVRQLSEKTEKILRVPSVDEMLKYPWGQEMLVDNLKKIFQNVPRERVLVRYVQTPTGPEVRAVLSDSFMRIDSAGILGHLLEAAAKHGLHIADVKSTDLQWGASFVLPQIFEPIPNDPVLWGFHVRNSDFGNAAFVVEGFLERLYCTNKARRQEYYKRAHLGATLPDNLLLAQDTLAAQNSFLCLKARDVVDNLLSPITVDGELGRVKLAHEQEADVKALIGSLAKNGAITKTEQEAVGKIYSSPDTHLLPPASGKGSLWRLSNAFTLFAQSQETSRADELEKIGGSLLDRVKVHA